MPLMALRVVCGLEEVMAIFSPTKALVKVDLPTFGLPTKLAKPDLVIAKLSDQNTHDSTTLGIHSFGG